MHIIFVCGVGHFQAQRLQALAWIFVLYLSGDGSGEPRLDRQSSPVALRRLSAQPDFLPAVAGGLLQEPSFSSQELCSLTAFPHP